MKYLKILLALYWIALFVATHIPQSSMPKLEWSDKFYHFAAYAILSFLLACWLGNAAKSVGQRARAMCVVAIVVVGYAILDENTQRLIPGRRYDLLDILADSVGMMLGIAAFLLIQKVLSRLAWQNQETG